MNDKVAFSPEEAAHRAGVGRTLIFAEIKRGRLEAHKAGARTLVTADALMAWIKSLPRRGGPDSSTIDQQI
jgi:excisionase family DNA binding protein